MIRILPSDPDPPLRSGSSPQTHSTFHSPITCTSSAESKAAAACGGFGQVCGGFGPVCGGFGPVCGGFGPDHTVPSTPRPLTGAYSYLLTYLHGSMPYRNLLPPRLHTSSPPAPPRSPPKTPSSCWTACSCSPSSGPTGGAPRTWAGESSAPSCTS